MNLYRLPQGTAFSLTPFPDLKPLNALSEINAKDPVFVLSKKDSANNQVCGLLHHPAHLFEATESPDWFNEQFFTSDEIASLPDWLIEQINNKNAYQLNTAHPRWKERITLDWTKAKRIHVAGLGDVGSTLLMGLRLLGQSTLSQIGIFDLSPEKIMRWVHEGNQITSLDYDMFPEIHPLKEEDIFECDIFVFCVARQIPPIDSDEKDVRMAQFEVNSAIIKQYACKARNAGFQGLFAVVSDPVDHLCQVVYESSNRDEYGIRDEKGLFPEQIKGYGLGVMNARAHYHASLHSEWSCYAREGRVFGPHGEGLVVADSLINYRDSHSMALTEKTLNSNLAVRQIGFKPYVAPALSSACFPILATIRCEWHYSTVFMGGIYMGCRNRMVPYGTEWETTPLPENLMKRIKHSYRQLERFQW